MRIALGQLLSTYDPQQNLERVADLARRAGEDGADLLVLPEATMFAFGRSLKDVAEPLDGPWGTAVADLAREHGVAIVAGMFTPGDDGDGGDGRVRNTTVIALPDGAVRSYSKIHLFDAFGFLESDTVEPGEDPVTFTVDGTTVGVATCYDIRFPRLFTRLAHDGALVTVVGASWGDGPGKAEQWELLARARALDTTSYVVAVGQANPLAVGEENPENAPRGVGHSLVAAPDGTVVASLGEAPDYTVVDLDLDLVERTRKSIPVLKNAQEL
ncbi:carbon-nitrogen hydrolase family protein [Glutamicibacter protophormiae]|uniref:carbon-nitrogen hydrolase family protein n=1 Tax=unclassified Kocuria TaxID=2649579 RepID=UPI000F88D803|nr:MULTISPECIES: carbon-nitrogen hydrolase family protein [unclassified Kocuria]RUP82310.1 carbon-nitrogen hydrolase family protein [Kocuria sp. HSID17590]RUQ11204.1 carbon-nitrogen hydrolase family protein [Kocuria sp. HSID17582]WNB88285.1 carbon-nitrogen hydrolase family protein [Glutamicibacter protophormiae]